MEYVKFYGLSAEPFQNDLDDRFYYESHPHREARLRIARAVAQRKGLTVVLGDPGCGKTTLAHRLAVALDAEGVEARMFVPAHASCASGWLIPRVARSLGVEAPDASVPELVEAVHEALIKVKEAAKHPVILVDEAQILSELSAMEEFRALLNLLHDGRKLVSFVLFGLRDLAEIIRLDAPLAQRVDVRVAVEAMDRGELEAYVAHRLQCAGGQLELFSSDALDALWMWSGGAPRVVNTLADNALFESYLVEAASVDAVTIEAAATQLGLERAADEVPDWTPVQAPEAPREFDAAPEPALTPMPESPAHPGRALDEDEPGFEVLPPAEAADQPPPAEAVVSGLDLEAPIDGAEDVLAPVAPVLDEVLASFDEGADGDDGDDGEAGEASEAGDGVSNADEATADSDSGMFGDELEVDEPLALEAPPDTAESSASDAEIAEPAVNLDLEVDSALDELELELEPIEPEPDAEFELEPALEAKPEVDVEAEAGAGAEAEPDAESDAGQEDDHEFDLGSLLDEIDDDTDAGASASAPAKGPRIELSDDDDLDALFDQIKAD